jgi:TonB family protein
MTMQSMGVPLPVRRSARCAVAVLLALAAAGCTPHPAVKGVPQPPGRSPLSGARATQIWNRAGGSLSPSEAAELRVLLRDDPDREIRLAAAWAFRNVTIEGKSVSGADEMPRLDVATKPSYPRDAYRQGIEGRVLVEFLIDEQGAVAYAEVRESIPALDAEAVATVRRWRFRPAQLSGKPVPALAQAPVTFRIFGKPSKEEP